MTAAGAVVFDLFGTLVAAPTARERARAAARLAGAAGCAPARVEHYLTGTWRPRHDGTLPGLDALAAHLAAAVGAPESAVAPVAAELRALGEERIRPDPPVRAALEALRGRGVAVGVLSDAAAEVAAAWPRGPLSALADAAVFSCEAGAVKPDPLLYRRIGAALGVPAHRTLYVGDGGGDELRGALAAGMTPVAVRRRGGAALVFGETPWPGPVLPGVEDVPARLAELMPA
ncbi:HAD family hydrolase [Streptomonospora nanhaiensis]|uniref:Putative hydrolase of the HAD superfamily n=1 Tax=Streptomonospora nanhaiensis TaxID=1323731 RepID=A0A853BMW3_9ACTN|nr:HAD family hydrolase [Streptomonospora nanhaiensis]MBV2365336.1 HAD family hydrolase [Streptomonospora nanhaiensis]MBX9389439.1 HAD family hydrolase [Streptomonospora nanhaiensis]NYI95936.1 putative hydrolase of the HAD superfamily [Streptomonospora nanhaiensis]